MNRNGNVYAFVTDNIGSVTALVNTSGATGASYLYGPYGNVITRSGGEAPLNLTGYTGALTDLHTDVTGIPSTSYAHLGQRWHDPAAGSFTTQDTASVLANPNNGNRYAYAADNPVTNIDPTGRSCFGDILGTIGGVLGFGAAIFLAPETFSGSVLVAAAGFTFLGVTVNAAGSCLGIF
jgi:RHS repeat-associated protein